MYRLRFAGLGIIAGLLICEVTTRGSEVVPPEGRSLGVAQVQAVFEHRLAPTARPEARSLAVHLVGLCNRYRFDPAFVLSLIDKESSFRTEARSHKGALGLMQLLPSTARWMAEQIGYERYRFPSDLLNPKVNLKLGIAYLDYLRSRFPEPRQYLAAYNLGPTRVERMILERRFELGSVRDYVLGVQVGQSEFHAEGLRMALLMAEPLAEELDLLSTVLENRSHN